MSELGLAVNFFVALFALIDPVGNVPLFAAATTGATPQAQRRVALYIAIFAAVFLVLFFFTGQGILKFFGISMPAFRIAGGIMLFLLGLDMARDDFTAALASSVVEGEVLDAGAYARKHFERLIVPFGMPLLIGPGAISTVVIYASDATQRGWPGMVAGVAAILAIAVSILLAFTASGLLSRLLGKVGMTVVVRVLGLILCAMAVQFVIVGLSGATGGLIRASAAHPYPT